jgi:hypothetical protein
MSLQAYTQQILQKLYLRGSMRSNYSKKRADISTIYDEQGRVTYTMAVPNHA